MTISGSINMLSTRQIARIDISLHLNTIVYTEAARIHLSLQLHTYIQQATMVWYRFCFWLLPI